MIERRRQKRFSAEDNAFIVLHSDSIIVTSLLDINMNGLAFEYMTYNDEQLNKADQLDIFCDDDFYDFHLQNVPFEIISKANGITGDHFNSLITKRYSVKFGGLTSAQLSQLKYFIKHQTIHKEYKQHRFDSKKSTNLNYKHNCSLQQEAFHENDRSQKNGKRIRS